MSKLADGIRWFKQSFSTQINAAVVQKPFGLDLMTALATQETFEVWGNLFTTIPVATILEVCVGDTIDAPGRTAFPTTKSNLLTDPNGQQLFAIARSALEAVGEYNATYHKVAMANADKFCHGFGIFQYDIQFSRHGVDPDFFLNKKWFQFDQSLEKALSELADAQTRAGFGGKASLSDLEQAYVAIAYNAGSFNPSRGLKQGFKDRSSGKYYGELIFEYLNLSKSI
ncbi:peptide-binding protein [Mesorhizobium carmichaelinearum]|uniref:peptide-binding protein n=1 Tax=Mesorhizobium carmichaelinearum TaxID=1208188 RepID=UPI000BA348C5|nr:peptide-binding protein [Mesorhizobium carmichaelinearum]